MALPNFLGAIRQAIGSCYLIESRDGAKVLLECGRAVEKTKRQ